ncbi:MAG: pentapeptide repeat-containing protein [Planctomycetota bacterium]
MVNPPAHPPGPPLASEPGESPSRRLPEPTREESSRFAADSDLIGADLSGQDFSGADLSGCDLSRANLCGANFAGANLKGAVLFDVDAEGAEFAGASLAGARLDRGRFAQAGFGAADLAGVQADGAYFGHASFLRATAAGASFVGATLRGARMNGADLTSADLRRSDLTRAELVDVDVTDARFDDADVTRARMSRVTGFRAAGWLGVDAMAIDCRGASFLQDIIKDQNFIAEFRSQGPMYEWTYRVWWLTSDCGRSAMRWGLCSAFLASLFAVLYGYVKIDFGDHETALSPFYFSVVTLTTLGYGDAVPATAAAQIVVMIEVVFGYVMLGGLLSLVSTKLSRRAV